MAGPSPRVVAIGGTTAETSSTEHALLTAVVEAKRLGASVRVFNGSVLARLPHYGLTGAADTAEARTYVASVRRANGILIASPGWHGTVSGLVKNALDYLEETARDPRPYLDGLPVGLIATAYGPQAASGALGTLRSVAHALRGWPTPLGVAINSSGSRFVGGRWADPEVTARLSTLAQQVVAFAARPATAAGGA